ncbi:MAG: PAS domain-containing protein [Candidatus Thiodiazotropha sp. (ex Lucinoma borealis)]|nr:PAS domain-containing protein [Candidatus Thiodiazotropha sp. (ex Lucinoma borealis)]
MTHIISPTGKDISLTPDDFIVSKTDPKGRITYANRVFMSVSGYKESELLGVQQNIVRHPDMPRAIFKLLWETIQSGNECFAYIKNLCKNGDHYWVCANVSPDYDSHGGLNGYFSVRRKPKQEAVDYFSQLYKEMLSAEVRSDSGGAIQASSDILHHAITEQGFESYESFVLGF